MIRYFRIALISIFILAPAGVWAQDSLRSLITELNLEQAQIDKIQQFLDQFAQKQDKLPTVVDEAIHQREALRQVITEVPFNREQALRVSQQVASVAAVRMVNRLELRNQIFHMLNQKQQQQYIQFVQQNLMGSE